MRILITGGAGFIGSALIRHIIQYTPHHVLNIDKLTYAGDLTTVADVATDFNEFFKLRGDLDRLADALFPGQSRSAGVFPLINVTEDADAYRVCGRGVVRVRLDGEFAAGGLGHPICKILGAFRVEVAGGIVQVHVPFGFGNAIGDKHKAQRDT